MDREYLKAEIEKINEEIKKREREIVALEVKINAIKWELFKRID